MRSTFNREQIINIIYGATFFGAGGGGSIANGMDLLNLLGEDVSLNVDTIDEMAADAYSVMSAGLGSPLAMKEKGFGPEAINVVKGMIDVARSEGKRVDYVYSGEQGGFNTMVPIYAALSLGMPMLDLDGNGRAVPELNTGLLPIYDIPIDPLVLSNANGDIVVGHPKDPLDSVACETIARSICMAYGMSVGFSTWMMSKADHEKASALGQLSLAEKVGAILRDPATTADNLSERLTREHVLHRVFTTGTISKIDVKVENGFDFGKTIIAGNDGETYKVDFKNENLIIRDAEDRALLVVPEIITLIDTDTMKPLSNADTAEGQNVMLLGVKAPQRWWDIPAGYDCWAHILKLIGYSKADVAVPLF
ncbi:MAG: DUF917 domain-containing protein [Oscillospiraceae bacterium]|nr:DUF917 domain-containing protein [Oscillospiraceae bacterium]